MTSEVVRSDDYDYAAFSREVRPRLGVVRWRIASSRVLCEVRYRLVAVHRSWSKEFDIVEPHCQRCKVSFGTMLRGDLFRAVASKGEAICPSCRQAEKDGQMVIFA